jgi:uncharacterized protein (DUF433 family)
MSNRVISDPKKFDSEPFIKGTDVMISMISKDIEEGLTVDEILERYTELTKEDVSAAYSYYLTGTEL